MPTYEYRCEKCGKTFEAFQQMSDPRLDTCDDAECGGKARRLISAGSGLIFKGSGFYITDYKKKSGGEGDGEKKKESSAGDKAKSEPAKKTESAKTETKSSSSEKS